MREEKVSNNPRFFEVNSNGVAMSIKVIEKWNDTYICLFEKSEMVDPFALYGALGFSVISVSVNKENQAFFYAITIGDRNELTPQFMEHIWSQIRGQL